MTRIDKLYRRLLAGSTIRFAEFERLLRAFGFRLDHVRGSHHIYKHPSIAERVNAQPLGKDAKPYQIRQFVDIIEANGLKPEDDE